MDTLIRSRRVRDMLRVAVLKAMDRAHGEMVWGQDDCGLWCANILRSVLGYDPACAQRGLYHSRSGAICLLGPDGVEGALVEIAQREGWQEVSPLDAESGDMGLAWTVVQAHASSEAVCVLASVICLVPKWFVGRASHGWSALRAGEVQRAWAVL